MFFCFCMSRVFRLLYLHFSKDVDSGHLYVNLNFCRSCYCSSSPSPTPPRPSLLILLLPRHEASWSGTLWAHSGCGRAHPAAVCSHCQYAMGEYRTGDSIRGCTQQPFACFGFRSWATAGIERHKYPIRSRLRCVERSSDHGKVS